MKSELVFNSCPVIRTGALTGSGTADDPYGITNAEGWELIAEYAADGKDTSGMYFRQDANIETSVIIGTKDHPFKGVYDGNGKTLTFTVSDAPEDCAPFRYIQDAEIRNLRIKGKITTSNRWAAGLAANARRKCLIENCVSAVVIDSEYSGDATHAGFISAINDGYDSDVTLKGCAFCGEMLGAKSEFCGGLVGFARDRITFEDCVFAPSALTVNPEKSQNFTRFKAGTSVNFVNCRYFDRSFNADQGNKCFSVTCEDGVELGFGDVKAEYPVSGITVYETGIKYGGVLYARQGETVIISAPENQGIFGFTASAGTIAEDGGRFRLTMPGQDVVIKVKRYGDVDNDGSVTPTDAMILARYLAGWSGYDSRIDLTAADVDKDDSVTLRDAVILARHLAGWDGYKILPYKT